MQRFAQLARALVDLAFERFRQADSSSTRASTYLYTTIEEVDQLIAGVEAATTFFGVDA